jgi:aryl-alcohol dehydrogenase-like predicted oxidoreductase
VLNRNLDKSDMRYRILGRTGWRVGEIGCGTHRSFDLPGAVGQEQVLTLMKASLGVGINLFDSAPMYGDTERNIGAALATLAAEDPRPGTPAIRIAKKVEQRDRRAARQQFEASRPVLRQIDLLQIHNMVGWRVVLPLLAELKAEGLIGATGVTQRDSAGFDEVETAMRTGLIDVIQIPYNLLQRDAEHRLLPLAHDLGLGVLAMTPISPLGGRDALLARLEGLDLEPLRPFGVADYGTVCLKYLVSKSPGVVLLPATGRPARVTSNAAVSDSPPFPSEVLRALEQRVSA